MGENVHVGSESARGRQFGRGNLCRSRRQRVVFRPGQFQHSPGPVLSFHLQDCAGPIRRRQHPNHRSAVNAVGKVIFRRYRKVIQTERSPLFWSAETPSNGRFSVST